MTDTRLNDERFEPEREELVAYLDGELEDDACSRVERRLADDADYRDELQRLQRAWDCLDHLPHSTLDETFARSTIEMVAVAASAEVEHRQAAVPTEQRTRAVLTAITLLASLMIGMAAAAALWPDPNRRLVDDLPLLENLDAYLQVGDAAFLRMLHERDGLVEPDEATPPEPPAAVRAVPERPDARRQWIERMTADEKAHLERKLDRFAGLPPEQQARIRKLHQEIESDPDADRLRVALAQYYDWISELSPGQRAELSALDPVARIERIDRMQQHERRRRLTSADMQALISWLDEYLMAHREQIFEAIPEARRSHTRKWFNNLDENGQRSALRMMATWMGRRGDAARRTLFSQKEMDRLAERLSPPAQRQLEQAGSGEQKQALIKKWIGITLRARFAGGSSRRSSPQVSNEKLETYFDENLSNDERERLLNMPREDVERELRMFVQGSGETDDDRPGRGSPPRFDRPPSFDRYPFPRPRPRGDGPDHPPDYRREPPPGPPPAGPPPPGPFDDPPAAP